MVHVINDGKITEVRQYGVSLFPSTVLPFGLLICHGVTETLGLFSQALANSIYLYLDIYHLSLPHFSSELR